MNNEGSSFLRCSTSPSVSLLLSTGCWHHCPGQHQHHLLRATLSVTRAILSFQRLLLRTILSFCSPQPRRNREGNHLSDFISHCCWEPAIGRVRRNTGRWWYWKKNQRESWVGAMFCFSGFSGLQECVRECYTLTQMSFVVVLQPGHSPISSTSCRS